MITKQIHGKIWDAAPRYWSKFFEPYFLPVYKTALRQLDLSEDICLLDAGCGAGLFSGMAIATGANVTGMDTAPGLLELARLRNPHNNFMEEDLEDMPFEKESFHVVTGFNSFQHAVNIEKAFAEAKRVLKPGGRLVLGVWDKPCMSDVAVVLEAMDALLPGVNPVTAATFAMSTAGKMEAMMERTGFEILYRTRISCPFLFQSLGQGIKSFMAMGTAAAVMNEKSQEAVEETIAAALQPFHISDDIYFLTNHLLLFIAEK